jgi:hypothetical protein
MQHDPDNVEDMMKQGEDHGVDSARYAAMSRPYVTNLERKQPNRIFAVGPGNQLTINDVMDDAPRRSAARYERIK